MPRTRRAASRDAQPSYEVWKAAAAKELQDRHSIAATAIPERVWWNLYARRLRPVAAANRAEVYYRSIRPAGMLWRETK